MFELVKKVKILTVICCICSIHQIAFAQRVESSAERNDEVVGTASADDGVHDDTHVCLLVGQDGTFV